MHRGIGIDGYLERQRCSWPPPLHSSPHRMQKPLKPRTTSSSNATTNTATDSFFPPHFHVRACGRSQPTIAHEAEESVYMKTADQPPMAYGVNGLGTRLRRPT